MSDHIYKGDIVAGSLHINESRTVADLLISGHHGKDFLETVLSDNRLQKRSPLTAKRQAKLIRSRLLHLDPELWTLLRDGTREQATQIALYAAMKQSRLLSDFIADVVVMQIRTFQKQVTHREWAPFFEECGHRDPHILEWAESTTRTVRKVVFKMLAEAGIIDSKRTMNIVPFALLPEVRTLLLSREENELVQTLEALG